LALPVGTVIQLDNVFVNPIEVPLDRQRFPNGRADATVTGLRLWGAQSSNPILILEVTLSHPGTPRDKEWAF
jgi:hypothetical protein